jgi:hypothetical protein
VSSTSLFRFELRVVITVGFAVVHARSYVGNGVVIGGV